LKPAASSSDSGCSTHRADAAAQFSPSDVITYLDSSILIANQELAATISNRPTEVACWWLGHSTHGEVAEDP
jgi:hypothetical protein